MTERKYRSVRGQFNKMAVCSACDRDATQTRISSLCVDIVNDAPTRCDECRHR